MVIRKYAILESYGIKPIPNSLESILEKNNKRPVEVTLLLQSEDELKKFLEFKKSLDDYSKMWYNTCIVKGDVKKWYI